MSATIILIMTSSSTRKTEPPGGRVVVMMMSLPVPDPRIANNVERRNVNVLNMSSASLRLRTRSKFDCSAHNAKVSTRVPPWGTGILGEFSVDAGTPLSVRVPEQQVLLRDRCDDSWSASAGID